MKYNTKYEIGISGTNVYCKNLKNNQISNIYGGFSTDRIDKNNSRKENVTLEFGSADKNGDYVSVFKNVEMTWYPLLSEYTVRQDSWSYEMNIERK